MSAQENNLCLENLPIPLYGSVMGLTGLAMALAHFEHRHGDPFWSQILLYAVSAWFVVLSIAYLAKWARYPAEVNKEYQHPVRMNFFPAISISLLLLSIGYLESHHGLSAILWYTGTLLHLFFLLRTLRVWFFRGLQMQTFNPAWFIPVVGTILVPVAGVSHAPVEISWFFFSVGIIFWLALLGITLNRVIFHNGLPPKLLPTLFILIAPPAVGFIAYIKLTGSLDAFAQVLYFHGLFMTLLVLTFTDRFVRLPFFLSWWAYTFPLAAASLSSFLYASLTSNAFFATLATALLILLALVIVIVGARTIKAAARKELCVPEE